LQKINNIDMAKRKIRQKKNDSDKEDMEELTKFKQKKKIQNNALNKILQEFNLPPKKANK